MNQTRHLGLGVLDVNEITKFNRVSAKPFLTEKGFAC